MDTTAHIALKLKEAIQRVLSEESNVFEDDVILTKPPTSTFGDFTTNIALRLGKKLGKNPLELAEQIVAEVASDDTIEKVDAVQPGFLNIYVKKGAFSEEVLKKILSPQKQQEQIQDSQKHVKKVIIEHTSVNPNKAMHVGHLRNAILGDSLARLYRRLGYKVEVHNYIDNTGVQVADTYMALTHIKREQKADERYDDYCWDMYAEINRWYAEKPELLEERTAVLHDIENAISPTIDRVQEIVEKMVDCHIELMAMSGIQYDLLTFESDVVQSELWDEAFEYLKKSPNFVLKKEGRHTGCWVLQYDDDKIPDKVFVRANGTKVYTAKDTAYHLWKFGVLKKDFTYTKLAYSYLKKELWRTSQNGQENHSFGKADMIINVIDERQTYPQEMVRHALHSVGFTKEYENYHHIAYGVVNLSAKTAEELGLDTSDNKAHYAMSGRKGIGVRARQIIELLSEELKKVSKTDLSNEDITKIATGALKQYMLKANPASPIIFDYEQALQFTGNSGPYLQYSYTRARRLLEKSGPEEIKNVYTADTLSASEDNLISLLQQWEGILKDAEQTRAISAIAEYAYRLSATFHNFYEVESVLQAEQPTRDFRLTLVKAYLLVIKDVLNILGIETLEKM